MTFDKDSTILREHFDKFLYFSPRKSKHYKIVLVPPFFTFFESLELNFVNIIN